MGITRARLSSVVFERKCVGVVNVWPGGLVRAPFLNSRQMNSLGIFDMQLKPFYILTDKRKHGSIFEQQSYFYFSKIVNHVLENQFWPPKSYNLLFSLSLSVMIFGIIMYDSYLGTSQNRLFAAIYKDVAFPTIDGSFYGRRENI